MKISLQAIRDQEAAKNAPVSALILNEKPLETYVIELEGGTPVNWLQVLACLEKRLLARGGYRLVSAAAKEGAPVLSFGGDIKPLRVEIGYRVTRNEQGFTITFGSTVAALAGLTLWLDAALPASATGEWHLTLSEAEGEIGRGENRPTVTAGTDVRAVTYNVLGVGERTDLIAASVIASTPDFVGMQEFFSGAALIACLRRAGYHIACEKLNTASPYSIRTNNVKYEHIGAGCCTPIFYRAAAWKLVEETSYLFHWQNRCPHTNTKSVAFALFESKADDAKKVLIVNFHAALVLTNYQEHYLKFPEGEHCRPGLTEKEYGPRWRLENNRELIREIDEMRAKYPALTVVVIGDMNGTRDEPSIRLFDEHETLCHTLDLAPDTHCDNGPTFHPVGSDRYVHAVPIDHVYVTQDTVKVAALRVARSEVALASSDHCPVMADLAIYP